MTRLLTFSTLYPNAEQPGRGIFVEARLRQLVAIPGVAADVVAPLPWFPFRSHRFGEYAELARAPAAEERHGLRIVHPRYPLIPKVGMSAAPLLMALALWPRLRQLVKTWQPDLIDAHYFYPDGVAAAILGRWLNLPVVITARGTDINLIPGYAIPRRWILWAGQSCAAMIAVCQALKDEMAAIGLDANKITVLRNGVDLDFFHPQPPAAPGDAATGSAARILSVGYLVERKRHDLVISALPLLPQHRLTIVGTGPEKSNLLQQAQGLGVAGRVEFAGHKSQAELVGLYSQADALVLMSDREGMANVMLESLACGTPVVARNVWGAPEIVSEPVAGQLVDNIAPQCIAAAIRSVTQAPRGNRHAVRRFAERFSWEATTRGQLQLFERLLAGRRQGSALPGS